MKILTKSIEGKVALTNGYQQQYRKAIQQGSDEGLLVPKSVGSSDVSKRLSSLTPSQEKKPRKRTCPPQAPSREI